MFWPAKYAAPMASPSVKLCEKSATTLSHPATDKLCFGSKQIIIISYLLI
jgi:hypothetical protein